MPNNDAVSIGTSQTVSDVLLSEHLITQAQYDDLKVKTASQGVSDESLIQSQKLVPEAKLAEAKDKVLGVPFISCESTSFSPQPIGLIPSAVVETFQIVPFMYDENSKTLSVA